EKVEKMEADLGGTEILQPLKHIYSQACIPKHPRQVFVFTDGEVGNTKEVTDLVKKNAGSHRCFSFGIGEGASSALINGMAKEGGGHAQFITGADRMQPKVMQSLRFALQPAVEDISVSWDLPKGVSATVLSPPITAIFQGQRSLIYAQLTGQSSEEADCRVTVKYSLAGHPSQNQLHFNLKPAEDSGLTVHRLAARTVIRSLESEERTRRGQQDEKVKKKVVELSVQSGVSSCFTAFIAVNKDSGKAVQGPLVRRNVPTVSFFSRLTTFVNLISPDFLYSFSVLVRSCSGPRIPDHPLGPMVCLGSAPPVDFQDCSPPRRIQSKEMSCRSNAAEAIDSDDDLDSERSAPKPVQPHKDPLLQLVSLQKASGSWMLDEDLTAVLGKTKEEVEKAKPELVNNEVWASILALIWLHAFKMDAKEEWELLSMKAASWIKAQNAPCVSECVEAGNKLLGCSVKKEALSL
ncbi:PREDICTED: von Willebrand factor A domain-containing protein 5A-like, partial [Poecilia mexicana]|uniref:von Willebrand factor A domain-containing protein 5A-like n=1 Tax=Poecilia mexicana TaxID=48701 RepID=UPI00072DC09D